MSNTTPAPNETARQTARRYREDFEEDMGVIVGDEGVNEFEEFACAELERYGGWDYATLKVHFTDRFHARRDRERREREAAEREAADTKRREEREAEARAEIEAAVRRRKAAWLAAGGTEAAFPEASVRQEIVAERVARRRSEAAPLRSYW